VTYVTCIEDVHLPGARPVVMSLVGAIRALSRLLGRFAASRPERFPAPRIALHSEKALRTAPMTRLLTAAALIIAFTVPTAATTESCAIVRCAHDTWTLRHVRRGIDEHPRLVPRSRARMSWPAFLLREGKARRIVWIERKRQAAF
jgi:hypothetical protein